MLCGSSDTKHAVLSIILHRKEIYSISFTTRKNIVFHGSEKTTGALLIALLYYELDVSEQRRKKFVFMINVDG